MTQNNQADSNGSKHNGLFIPDFIPNSENTQVRSVYLDFMMFDGLMVHLMYCTFPPLLEILLYNTLSEIKVHKLSLGRYVCI